ncbi:FecR family protein [Chitinophaga sp.]|uniref:FecR family protein n=1 Tax=Chitinophaga sp. TaxID=1869181 RepID=UPI00261183F2|nr:FecR family protein [uncultured Chitinophaga sp.]
MLDNNDDKNIDWDKVASRLDGDKAAGDFTSEELRLLAAEREMKVRLARPEFSEQDGWRQFSAVRGKRRIVRIVRLAVAAVVLLAVATGVWMMQPVRRAAPQSEQLADAKPSGKVQLKMGDGRSVELGEEQQTIQQGSGVQITAGSATLAYSGSAAKAAGVRMDTLVIPRGLQFSLQLSDGTQVWINSATTLRYPPVFNGATRDVYVDGEAYFEVKANAAQPFIVHAGEGQLKVLGTAFNVNTFGVTTTTLTSGRLLVAAGGQQQQLDPGEQTVFRNGTLGKQTVDTQPYTAWKDGDLLFYDVSLAEITRYLARNYDYDFEFNDTSLENLRFTLDMPRPANLQVALDVIGKGLDIGFSVQDKTVRVSKAGQGKH